MIRFTGPDGMSEPITRQELYSDGTPRIKTQGWDRIIRKADSVTVQASSLSEFVNAMFLVDAVNLAKSDDRGMSGCDYIDKLVLPYLPGARQDRSNSTGDVLFTASSVARMINDRYFPGGVVSLDPHSHVMPDMINHFREYPLENAIKQIYVKYAGVIAPDKGAKNRAKRVADTLGVPLFYGGKTRDVATGKLTGFTLDPINNVFSDYRGKHFLVADDICDGGGTFIGLAEKIAEQGATADLYVSHGIFSKGFTYLDKVYKTVYTTDSYQGREGAVVIPVVKDMENF